MPCARLPPAESLRVHLLLLITVIITIYICGWQPWKGSCKHLPSINMGVSSSRGFLVGLLRDLSISDAAGCLGAVGTALGHNGGMRWGQTVGFTAWDLAKGGETASLELPGTAAAGEGTGAVRTVLAAAAIGATSALRFLLCFLAFSSFFVIPSPDIKSKIRCKVMHQTVSFN